MYTCFYFERTKITNTRACVLECANFTYSRTFGPIVLGNVTLAHSRTFHPIVLGNVKMAHARTFYPIVL